MGLAIKSIYNLATGQIRGTVFCPEEDMPMQYDPATEGLLDGEVDDSAFYVAGGELVPIPARPSPKHQFDWGTHTWVDPRTLADLRAAKWEAIKLARAQAEFGGFVWDGDTFDSDRMSQSRIQGAAQLAQLVPEFTIDWTLADNSVRTLSAADMVAVGTAMGQHVNTVHAHARDLRAQIATATEEELALINW